MRPRFITSGTLRPAAARSPARKNFGYPAVVTDVSFPTTLPTGSAAPYSLTKTPKQRGLQNRNASSGANGDGPPGKVFPVPGLGTVCQTRAMLKGEDIVVLLRLIAGPDPSTVRSLEAETGIARSVIQRSLVRLEQAGLLGDARRRVNLGRAEELLVHGVKYMFPPVRRGEARGVATAWAAPPLKERLAASRELPPVWPDPMGEVRGIALQPLHASAPGISRRDRGLTELLALGRRNPAR